MDFRCSRSLGMISRRRPAIHELDSEESAVWCWHWDNRQWRHWRKDENITINQPLKMSDMEETKLPKRAFLDGHFKYTSAYRPRILHVCWVIIQGVLLPLLILCRSGGLRSLNNPLFYLSCDAVLILDGGFLIHDDSCLTWNVIVKASFTIPCNTCFVCTHCANPTLFFNGLPCVV